MADYKNNADVEQQSRLNALYQLIGGAAQRQTDANIQGMRGQQAMQQQQQGEALKQQGQDAAVQRIQQMNDAGMLNEGGSVSGGDGVSVGKGPNPNAQSMQSAKTLGAEAKGVQGRFDKLAQPFVDTIHASDKSEDYIRQNNFKAIHAEQVMNAKAMIGQRMAQQEIGMVNNPSLVQGLQNKINQWTNDTNAPVLTKDEQDLMLQLNNTARSHAVDSLNTVHKNIVSSLPTMAPYSFQQGRTADLANGLTTYKNDLIAPQQQTDSRTSSGAVAIPAPQANGVPTIAQRGASWLNGLIGGPGGSPKPQAQVAQQQPAPAPGSFSGLVPPSTAAPTNAAPMSPRDQLNVLRQKQGPLPSAGGGN